MSKSQTARKITGSRQQETVRFHLIRFWRVVLRKKWTIISFLILVAGTTAYLSFTANPVFNAGGTLLIEKEPNILTFEEIYQIESLRDDYLQTQINLLDSRKVAQIVVDTLRLHEQKEFLDELPKKDRIPDLDSPLFRSQMIDIFLERLDIIPVAGTRLVEVRFNSQDPILAAEVVNTFLRAYINWNIETRFAATEQASEFLTDQISSLRAEIQEKEQGLQEYGEKRDILVLNNRETTVVDKLSALNKALSDAQIERVQKQTFYNEIKNASPDYIPESMTNNLIQKLREDYQLLKREYLKGQEKFRPNYPAMKRLETELNSAKQALRDETQNLIKGAFSDFRAAQERENSLKEAFELQKKAAVELNSNSILYNSLKVEIENSNNLLQALMKRQSETHVSAQLKDLKTSSIKIINEAEIPLIPSSPNKKLNMILALLFGLIGGLGLAFLFEALDGSVKGSEDVSKYTNLPTLGVIPSFNVSGHNQGDRSGNAIVSRNGSSPLVTHHSPDSMVSESYRNIRAVLLSDSFVPKLKTIAVSSALPDEGKTTTVSNLAVSLAQLGKKVILIDADLRKPSIHKLFHIKNNLGLSDCLLTNFRIEGLIKATKIPNLFVINAGSVKSSPAEILGSSQIREFTEALQRISDFILFDVPPILSVSDATALNSKLDGMILVVKGDKTSGDLLQLAAERLEMMKINPLGIIINDINARKSAHYDRHSYCAYRYGRDYEASQRT
jgi:succinoglycan biosynthesis transport protein ExoP